MRESSPLPAGRADDDGDGGLEIRDVQLEDSGLYICVARLGRTVSRVNTSLSVGGGYNQPLYSDHYNYPGYSAPAMDRSGLLLYHKYKTVFSTLIGREDHSVATPALLCHKEPA